MTTPAPSSALQEAAKPSVFFLSLKMESWADEMYSALIDMLSAKASIKRAKASTGASNYLENNTLSAILVTDPDITSESRRPLLALVKSFVSNGGVAIFAWHFSSLITVPKMDAFWRTAFNLPWKAGNYQRTTVHLNVQVAAELGGSDAVRRLPLAYSQKALFLRDVDPANRLYSPIHGGVTESHDFPGELVDSEQAALAWAQFGEGWIGYIGDINAEQGSDKAIAAMCRLGEDGIHLKKQKCRTKQDSGWAVEVARL